MPDGPLPLPALLSAAFVAFTIEADNAAEQAVVHHTTWSRLRRRDGSVWLTSLAMWFNCLRGLTDGGEQTVAELERRARMPTNLDGMRRWGYITIDGTGRVPRGSPRPRAKPTSVIGLTARGQDADAVWRPLPDVIEARWRERFGTAAVDSLRAALSAVAARSDAVLPDFMPIRWFSGRRMEFAARPSGEAASDAGLPLISLLSRVLLQFTLDCDRAGTLPLALWSDLVRVLDPDAPVAVRDLPTLTGVSKEALSAITGRLHRAGVVVLEPRPAPARGQQLRLTADRGVRARDALAPRITRTVRGWESTYGQGEVTRLIGALAPIVGDGTREGSPLFAGLDPPPDGWRARVPPPRLLPWYPLVLHRGGYPDGS